MIQGTSSDAGKTTMVAGLCRLLYRRGIRVAPFKPQNMALNSAVTADGGEIGRAQALQARACGLKPTVHMNPILIKPTSDTGAQIIVHGKVHSNMTARFFHDYKPQALEAVLHSFRTLHDEFDFVVVEGAGSPAEVNLRDRDIANMGFAEAVDCPVMLVGDIDRGGVLAHFVGTLQLLSESERARTVGLLINRFRGDLTLLQPGVEWLERTTGKPVAGVVPYLHGLYLEEEDRLVWDAARQSTATALRVIVPALPHISNSTDFDALRMHPQVDFAYIGPGATPPAADLVILPGSKSVRGDLRWLIANGWDKYLARHLRYGGKVIGICGGYQMLGRSIHDPHGVEGLAGSSRALGFVEVETMLETTKVLQHRSGILSWTRTPVTGYEIHMGVTSGPASLTPAIILDDHNDGVLTEDGQLLGTYLHGIFDSAAACRELLAWAGVKDPSASDSEAAREASLDRLADALEESLSTEFMRRWCG